MTQSGRPSGESSMTGPMHTPRSTAAVLVSSAAAWQQALWIIAAATFARLLLAASVPLFPDETYYWEWSRRLAFGYFDHPPVIAWAIAAGTAIFGDTPIGVRLVPILLGAVASLAIAATTRTLASDNAARFAAILMAAMPLSAVGFVLATPDAPLLASVAVTLYFVVRAVDPRAARAASTRHWLLAGLAIGLAMASKFTGVFVPIAVLLAIVMHKELQPQLRAPGPYIAVLVASLVMAPVLWWNAQHEWIAFRFQLGHGLGTAARGSWWQRELELIGGQLLLVTPILFGAFLLAIHRALNTKGSPQRFLLAEVALFCLGFFVYSATRKPVEANWPALAWVPAFVLVAASRPAMRTIWERNAAALAGAITVVLLSQVLVPWFPVPASRDPVAKAHGWRLVADSVQQIAAAERAADVVVHLTVNRYQDAAQLAFNLPEHPTVYALNLGTRRNQYDMWPRVTAVASAGATMLFLLDERGAPPDTLPPAVARLAPHYASVTMGPLLPLQRAGKTSAQRRVWVLRGWNGRWPDDPTDPLKTP